MNSQSKSEVGFSNKNASTQTWILQELNNEEHDRLDEVASSIYGGIATSVRRPQLPIAVEHQEQSKPTQKSVNTSEWSPATQNLLDRPTAAFPKQIILGGMAFCIAFGIWAWFGKINEVGQAQGELVPQGEAYKVHPVEMGKVANIPVGEGDRVEAGQVLLELDTKLATTEVDRLQQQQVGHEKELVQKQALLERLGMEAETRNAVAQANITAQSAAIAKAETNVETTRGLLTQLQSDVTALEERYTNLKPLAEKSRELLVQLKADVDASRMRRQELAPLENKTDELIKQLKTDMDASRMRRQQLAPLTEQTQKLIQQLEADVAEHQERVKKLEELLDEGAISGERFFQARQTLRDREHALLRAYLTEKNQAQEQLFAAEQALRDRENAIIRAQLAEKNQAQEQLFTAEQTLRDRENAIIRAQLAEETQAREKLFEVEQSLRDRRTQMTETEGKLQQGLAEVEQLQAQLAQKQAEAKATDLEMQQRIQQLEVELTQLRAKITETKNLLTAAETKLEKRFVYAPVSGVVLSLDITNIGEVVQPGQTIAEIGPENAQLVLSAKLPNPEAGFIEEGMSVQLKFDAYPYQDYGVISGTVASVSPDTEQDEQMGDVYQVEITLERNYVTENGETISFKPGQTANADIIIRRRRVADILLDPIRKMKEEGINF
ncbi:MAG: HlyD family efflux transporter periplasmic adaptor subunit [Okeania sp. SIO3I5]|uniref:HlyD family efflux transporter periplasmic adaptor subunit n=1 Tax=Okeania sp. SIO3I5 TaxID=2607805 RepID=UPI0013BB9792|nr:HlyD family efflux transporter periplasmic adaptor subunit [Okeania sp. SIO3I5]NEQ40705.1 HlyD family efflux transporter periplasmic adaptor subunit [Okeania sp. SIO3I5]